MTSLSVNAVALTSVGHPSHSIHLSHSVATNNNGQCITLCHMSGLTVLCLSVCQWGWGWVEGGGGGGGWKGVGVGVGVGVGAHTYSVGCERTPVCRSKLAARCNFLHWLD